MDETLSRVAIDMSGRPVLVFKVAFPRDKVGEFDTELVREWFQAFTINAGMTLHVETLYGENGHHIAESCFKGLPGRSVRRWPSIPRRAKCPRPRAARRLISVRAFHPRRRVMIRVYTVHAPVASGADLVGGRQTVFVRDGFHFLAAFIDRHLAGLAPALAGVIGWIVVRACRQVGHGAFGLATAPPWPLMSDSDSAGARSGQPAALDAVAAAWRQLDIVVADDATPPSTASSIAGLPASAASPATNGRRSRRAAADPQHSGPAVLQTAAVLPQGGIIGLFPQPGAPR